MRYLLLIYGPEWDASQLTPEQVQASMDEWTDYTADLVKRGAMESGEALEPTSTATTVRVRDGEKLTTDGPFAETKEGLGGFYLIEAKDLDEALALAAQCPGIRAGTIEVRPIWETGTGVPEDQAVGASAG